MRRAERRFTPEPVTIGRRCFWAKAQARLVALVAAKRRFLPMQSPAPSDPPAASAFRNRSLRDVRPGRPFRPDR